MIAAHKGFAKTVSALLNCNRINVDAATPDGFTALMIAARNGHTESVSALLNFKEINVNAETNSGFTALMIAANNGHSESVLAILSRNGVDWQIAHDQLSRLPQKPNKEVSALLAVAIPRNLIFRNLNQENPNNTIQQQDDDILGAGLEAYNNLNDLRSWHVRYLTDLGVAENEAKNLANQRFFDLLFNQENRQEVLARNNLVTELVAKSASLKIHFARNAEVTETEDQATLDAVKRLNPEDFYKLTTKIIDNSKAENDGIAKLQDLS
jgi:ankyrin repeat protein